MVESGAIARLAKAIGYPQEVSAEAEAFDFIVDGETIGVSVADGRARSPSAPHGGASLVFQTVLTEDEEAVARLAALATGRLAKEEATLMWDAETHAATLWAATDAAADGRKLRAFFEDFLNSADWWMDRAKEAGGARAGVPEMVIRP